ncbi:MAG: hypothetical protein M1816_002496 [Peltula sp. TS41687]|nr:MAG: hypothetical protein M1816_002496 [Peltula sp. TS41687]
MVWRMLQLLDPVLETDSGDVFAFRYVVVENPHPGAGILIDFPSKSECEQAATNIIAAPPPPSQN